MCFFVCVNRTPTADLDSSVLRLAVNRTNRDRSPLTEDLIGDRAKCFLTRETRKRKTQVLHNSKPGSSFSFPILSSGDNFPFLFKGDCAS